MSRFQSFGLKLAGAAALMLLASTAQAHVGHGTHGLEQGLEHPLGLDHLLAMVAVGIWSACAFPAGKVWRGPATFMLCLTAGAILGAAGAVGAGGGAGAGGLALQIGGVLGNSVGEILIALSVVVFGAMLVGASKVPPLAGVALIAAGAFLHGLAHGAEAPEAGFSQYALGFLLTTAVLHCVGVLFALRVRHWLQERSDWLIAAMGLACSGAGVYLVTQI